MYTKNQIKILTVLLNQPTKEYCLSELAEIFSKKPGIFQKAVNSLEREGIIESYRNRNRRLFHINQNYPLLKEIRSIIQKTAGVEGQLKKLVANINGIAIGLIYGSYAKDMMRVNSDIDVLLVGDSSAENAFLDEISKIEDMIQREINYRFYTEDEYKKKLALKEPFLHEVLSDKLILIKGKL